MAGVNTLRVAELWIRPARCALNEGDVEAERYYARFAARWFAEALQRNDVAPRERASMAYGLGELWLRLGDVRTAATWFERVTDEIVDQWHSSASPDAAERHVRDSNSA